VYDISLFIPEGICFAAFVAFVARGLGIKSETSYTLEDGHVGRNMYCRTGTTKRKTIYNKAARRRQLNLKTY
jgi:hypothetical protein